MDRDHILEAMLRSINEYSGREYTLADVDRSRPVFDYGVDSLNVMQILAELEDELGLELDLGQLSESGFASVDSLLDVFEEWVNAAPESV